MVNRNACGDIFVLFSNVMRNLISKLCTTTLRRQNDNREAYFSYINIMYVRTILSKIKKC